MNFTYTRIWFISNLSGEKHSAWLMGSEAKTLVGRIWRINTERGCEGR